MTIAMSEQVDAEPCDVLRGGDGPVYFLLGGQLYVVHEILGRWIEPERDGSEAAGINTAPAAVIVERRLLRALLTQQVEIDIGDRHLTGGRKALRLGQR